MPGVTDNGCLRSTLASFLVVGFISVKIFPSFVEIQECRSAMHESKDLYSFNLPVQISNVRKIMMHVCRHGSLSI